MRRSWRSDRAGAGNLRWLSSAAISGQISSFLYWRRCSSAWRLWTNSSAVSLKYVTMSAMTRTTVSGGRPVEAARWRARSCGIGSAEPLGVSRSRRALGSLGSLNGPGSPGALGALGTPGTGTPTFYLPVHDLGKFLPGSGQEFVKIG